MPKIFILIFMLTLLQANDLTIKKEHFTSLDNILSSAKFEMRYFTHNNFLGRPVKGYSAPICYLSNEAAFSLKKVEETLNKVHLQLIIFDCYRPQRAVNDFVLWAKELNNTKMKVTYYPYVQKKDLFKEGYIAARSGHSRGSTIDLSIEGFDMGTPFDFFDPSSYTLSPVITARQQKNRLYLRKVMEDNGFKNYPQEWWHYTLIDEPFKKHYFDFEVK